MRKKKKKVDVEALRDKDPNLKDLFWEVVRAKKSPKRLTKREKTALIERVGFLDDDERAFYSSVFVREKLTEKEMDRYRKLLLLNKYFPAKEEGQASGN